MTTAHSATSPGSEWVQQRTVALCHTLATDKYCASKCSAQMKGICQASIHEMFRKAGIVKVDGLGGERMEARATVTSTVKVRVLPGDM